MPAIIHAELDAGAGAQPVAIPTHDDLLGTEHRIRGDATARELKAAAQLPIFSTRSAAGTAPASGPAILVLGHAGAGRKWNLLGWTIVGADDHTTLSGVTAGLYVGDSFDSYSGLPPLSQLRDPANAVPSFQTYPKGSQWAASSEDVFVVVNGATSGQALVANVQVADFPESAVTAQTL